MKIYNQVSLILFFLLISCVKTDDFDIPKTTNEAQNITENTSILAVKNALNQSDKDIYTFDKDDDAIVAAFVISSDESGAFYKTLVVQNNPENPTAGIEILVDLKSYYTQYNFGRKVYIKMAGLSIVNNNGKYKIGYLSKDKVEEIPASLLDSFIVRSTETRQIIPKEISFSEFSNQHIATYISVSGIQFLKQEIGKTFAGEKFDEFNGERVLSQCDNKIKTILSTSTFSDFKSIIIPPNKGKLSAVFTKDFYAEKYILILNNLTTINFNDKNRCDASFLDCDFKNPNKEKIIFFENFQEVKKTKDLELMEWTNTNLYLGNETFNKRTSKGNVSMQISAYDTGENPLEVWLVSPLINLDSSTNAILTFDTKASYDNGTCLTAWVSTNFNGNIKDATWQQLDVKISVGPGNTYVNDYISSGKISLNCLNGNIVIALKYLGGDPGVSTTYDVDNFKISGE